MSDDTKALVERLRCKCVPEHDSLMWLKPDPLCTEAAATIERAQRELAEARKDAERYRWLRDPQNADLANDALKLWWIHMDAAIDAAMKGASDE